MAVPFFSSTPAERLSDPKVDSPNRVYHSLKPQPEFDDFWSEGFRCDHCVTHALFSKAIASSHD
jgi:hypothetical protein